MYRAIVAATVMCENARARVCVCVYIISVTQCWQIMFFKKCSLKKKKKEVLI